MRARTLVALAVAGGLILGAPTATGKTRLIDVQDDYFVPKAKTVKRNDVVRFGWSRADNPHNVKFTKVPRKAKRPRSCSVRTSGSCKRRLKRRGLYRYVCTIHLDSADMRGSIRVK